jgi:phosphatidylglycerophosphate synthase
MNIYALKSTGQKLLNPLMKFAIRFHPNTITLMSIPFAVGAGLCFYKSNWLWTLWVGPIFILLKIICNFLDGMVARARDICSSKGEALQEAIDRIADTAILLGLTCSPFGQLALGLIAIPMVLISSYLGILHKAVGGDRIFEGVMAKGDRLILIMMVSVIQFFWRGQIFEMYAFEFLLWVIIVGSGITIIQRACIIKKSEI